MQTTIDNSATSGKGAAVHSIDATADEMAHDLARMRESVRTSGISTILKAMKGVLQNVIEHSRNGRNSQAIPLLLVLELEVTALEELIDDTGNVEVSTQ